MPNPVRINDVYNRIDVSNFYAYVSVSNNGIAAAGGSDVQAAIVIQEDFWCESMWISAQDSAGNVINNVNPRDIYNFNMKNSSGQNFFSNNVDPFAINAIVSSQTFKGIFFPMKSTIQFSFYMTGVPASAIVTSFPIYFMAQMFGYKLF